MNNRIVLAFFVLGALLALIPLCLFVLPLLLHRTGVIYGWSGFGLFWIGSILLPWMLGFSLQSFLIGLLIKYGNWKLRSVKAVFALVLASAVLLGALLASRLPRMFPTESKEMPRELAERVVVGQAKFVKQLLFRQSELGVVSDIDGGHHGQITIVGRHGAASINPDGTLIETVSFEQCFADVVLVKVRAKGYFLCRGDYSKNQNTRLVDSNGKNLWSYGANNPGVFDAIGGDLGNGLKGIVVGFNRDGGLHLLDFAGRPVWGREESDIWHVEIAHRGIHADPAILHSNTRGQLTIRNGNGDVIARFAYPGIYLGRFSLSAWGAERNRDKLIVSHFDWTYVLGPDGTTIARLPAPMRSSRDPWTTYGTPMLATAKARYYATLQRYDEWNRSVLRIYDDQNRAVYEEVIAETCAALRSMPNKSGEALLLGCDGKLLRYSLRDE